MLNLRHVRTFVVVADRGSFRAGAQRLGLAQASVSHHIRRLEEELDTILIVRGPGVCELTGTGERFIDSARSLLRLAERCVADIAHPGDARLRIAASSNIGIYMLPRLLHAYRSVYPAHARPDIVIADNPRTVARIHDRTADIALTETARSERGLVMRTWQYEELVVIVSPRHPWAARASISRAELAGSRLLAGERGTGTGALLREFLAGLAYQPEIEAELGSTEAVKQAVAHDQGISLVLAATVADEVQSGQLRAITLAPRALHKPLKAIYRPNPTHGTQNAFLGLLPAAEKNRL